MGRRIALGLMAAVAGALVADVVLPTAARAAGDPLLLPPRRRAPLLAWLQSGVYRDTYTPEPSIHASAGPHGGNVRTWYSPTLVEDLADGRVRFRRGAAMVKELSFGGETVGGWAVMIKTHRPRRRSGRAWVWYETLRLDGRNAYHGRGLRLCSNCHRAGEDFLLSTFRP